MKNVSTILFEKDDDGYYVGSIPALPGCHSQARSVDQLMERMEEAIARWLEVEHETDSNPLQGMGRHTKGGSMSGMPRLTGDQADRS